MKYINHSEEVSQTPKVPGRPWTAGFIIVAGIILLCVGVIFSISLGSTKIDIRTVWDALFHFNEEITAHQSIRHLRLPRSLAAVLVGAAFAVSGAIMQGMTRNPMADSGLLGINAGAGFMLALCFAFFKVPFSIQILFSFVGAALGTLMVYGISGLNKGGLTPLRLTLAGAAVGALLSAFSQAIAIKYRIAQDLSFWTAGGLAGIRFEQVKILAPWVIAGLIGAMILARGITLLSLGDDVALGLGLNIQKVKALGAILVLILSGASVSVIGTVGFIGLVIPHIAKFLVGLEYKLIIPVSAVLGSLLVVVADTLSRTARDPYEIPIGTFIAAIGVPFFLYIARKQRRNNE